jgi:MbtH protein
MRNWRAGIVKEQKEESMKQDMSEETQGYKVVINHEAQYALWFCARENPPGWRDAGKSGTRAECLSYIKDVWTDMRPLSLRHSMQEASLGH